jgi:uncharacterized protein (DUF488 family)
MPAENQRAILTIGHSTHEAEDFLGLLERFDVETLADVRRHPGSRRVPWTGSDPLGRLLATSGIEYVHLESLGGRRRPLEASPNGGWRNAQFRGYADHMGTPEFAAGLTRLEAIAKERRAAVMCAEAQWWRCHRRLLSDILLVRGWCVLHLDSRGGSSEHELTEFAEVDRARVFYPAPDSGQLRMVSNPG